MSTPSIDSLLASGLGPLMLAAADREHEGLVILDPSNGHWVYANAAFAQWMGTPVAELLGRSPQERWGDAATALRAAEQTAAGQAAAITSEHRLEFQGTRREFSVLRQRVQDPDGQFLIAELWQDLTPRRKRDAQLASALEQLEQLQLANQQLRKEAQGQSPRDSTTGLYNRAHFDDQLRREVDLSTREHREFALVTIEIDPLNEDAAAMARVHDALGRLLRGNTRAMDASCRDAESRFAVLLSGVGLATAHSRMEGLRRQCATQIVVHGGRELGFTVSMGVASFPHTAQTQDELRAACDAALADARQRGGNRVTLASIRFDTP